MRILAIKNIRKSFGKQLVLSDINLELQAGTLTGITGENGSGKTTLLKIITGYLKQDYGTMNRSGRMGYCPQESIVYPQLTVKENFNYYSVAYGMSRSQAEKKREYLLDLFNYTKYDNRRVSKLSGGTIQKLNLSIALLHEPELLILDEPYNGFDWDTYLRFWEYTTDLKKSGCTILVVAHLLTNKEVFDAVYEINEGQLI